MRSILCEALGAGFPFSRLILGLSQCRALPIMSLVHHWVASRSKAFEDEAPKGMSMMRSATRSYVNRIIDMPLWRVTHSGGGLSMMRLVTCPRANRIMDGPPWEYAVGIMMQFAQRSYFDRIIGMPFGLLASFGAISVAVAKPLRNCCQNVAKLLRDAQRDCDAQRSSFKIVAELLRNCCETIAELLRSHPRLSGGMQIFVGR